MRGIGNRCPCEEPSGSCAVRIRAGWSPTTGEGAGGKSLELDAVCKIGVPLRPEGAIKKTQAQAVIAKLRSPGQILPTARKNDVIPRIPSCRVRSSILLGRNAGRVKSGRGKAPPWDFVPAGSPERNSSGRDEFPRR